MLVLARRSGERIFIGKGPNKIVVSVERVNRNVVRIGIEAPPEIPVFREEIAEIDMGK